MTGLIEPQTLAALLRDQPGSIKLVDATFADTAEETYAQRRIGSAVFFDIDAIADPDTALPHMLPAADAFAAAVAELGLSSGDQIVVYDQTGIAMAAARAWWMFRIFGHDKVRVLNGGLPLWTALGLPVESGLPPAPAKGDFKATFRPELVRDKEAVLKSSQTGDEIILDARSAARFDGQMPEPRPGLRAGHIPGSINVPYASLIDTKTGSLKNNDILQASFNFLDQKKNIVASCGSGVTACVLALSLYNLGRDDVAVYDGSWSEWGLESAGTPVA